MTARAFHFASARTVQGDPTEQALNISVLKRINKDGQVIEREVSKEKLTTDKKTGEASIRLKIDDEEGGSFVVRASGTDQFGNPIVSDRVLTISGKKDEIKLRLITDRTSFKVGETAEVRLINRGPSGTAFLTWEADKILQYKLISLKDGDNPLSWDVDGKQFPNFTLAASRMAKTEFHEARLDLRIERDLRVTIQPTHPSVGPGGEVEVEVTTTDQNGKPVAAELSLALVDRSLLRLFNDRLPSIGTYFYNQTRTSSFASESSVTFTYAPATIPVPEAIVEEAEREMAMFGDAMKSGRGYEGSRSRGGAWGSGDSGGRI